MGDFNPVKIVKEFKPIDFISDVVGTAGLGIFDLKKGRFYVPLSSGALRNMGKSFANVATLGTMRDEINDFGDSPLARGIGTVASALAMTLAGGAIASSMMAPTSMAASTGSTALAGTNGAIAPLASGAAPAIASGTSIGSAGAGSAEIGAALGTGVPGIAGSSTGWVAGTGAVLPTVANKLPGMVAPTPTSSMGADVTGELSGKVSGLNSSDTKGWFSSLSPGAQTALITGGLTVAQMGTGAMNGIFQGVSAQKKLELEQLINSQNQTQRERLNKNNEYAPLVQFTPRTGMAAPRSV